MQIIAMGGQKGGTGKTTTTISLAVEAHRRGQEVLVVDADPQQSTMTWAQVMVEAGQEGPSVIAMGEGLHRKDQLPRIAQSYDLVIIDCPPRFGKILRSALMVADIVVLPCGPSDVDAWALAETLDLVEEAQILRPDLSSVILLTRLVSRTTTSRSARGILEEGGHQVLNTELGYRVAYQKCLGFGQGPSSFEPGGKAAREMVQLYGELTNLKSATNLEVANVA